MPSDIHVCMVIANVGDYHAARIANLSAVLGRVGARLTVVDRSDRSQLYSHRQTRASRLMQGIARRRVEESGTARLPLTMFRLLRSVRPTHVFTLGYHDALSLSAVASARALGTKVYFMSESKADDYPRSRVGETVKSGILRLFHGALVGGNRHRDYYRSLGMRQPIEIGYDVVDNDFFAARARRLSARPSLAQGLGLPERYVLCVSRLVGRKRLDLVLKGYRESGIAREGYKLVVVGAGPLESQFLDQIRELGLEENVCHLRSVRNTMMPAVYAGAYAVVLASDYDQWGLCVNEAMSVGVPCIVTTRCGAAGEIVFNDENGFVVPCDDAGAIAGRLARLVADPALREQMSRSALDRMSDWNLDQFGEGALRLVRPSGVAA